MKILLIGATGQVGFELWRTLQLHGEIIPTTRKGEEVAGASTLKLNLVDLDDIERKLNTIQPDVICNAAAFTAVDAAESDQGLAYTINAEAVARIADYAKKNQALLIHYSTDYVFSGVGENVWYEKDKAEPLSVYGKSKLAGEQFIIHSGCEYLILRTAWVYAARGQNFLKTMLKLAESETEIKVVSDQAGSPTWAHTLAMATATALHLPQTGLYHVTCAGSTTWYGWAKYLFEQAHKIGLLDRIPQLHSITTEEYPTPATRPRNSVLGCDKFEKIFNVKLPHWTTALQLCMQRMKL